MEPVQDLQTFLDRSRGQAKLIYGDFNAGDVLLKDYRVRVDVEETVAIRTLIKEDVLIVTDPKLMRGLDYRSAEPEGMALLLTKQFPSKRTLKQALGRVGRFDEPCKRYRFDQMANLVDESLHYTSVGKLNSIVSEDKKKKTL